MKRTILAFVLGASAHGGVRSRLPRLKPASITVNADGSQVVEVALTECHGAVCAPRRVAILELTVDGRLLTNRHGEILARPAPAGILRAVSSLRAAWAAEIDALDEKGKIPR